MLRTLNFVSFGCLLSAIGGGCASSSNSAASANEPVLSDDERTVARSVPGYAAARFETSYGETFLGGINLVVGPGEQTRVTIDARSDSGRGLHGGLVDSMNGFSIEPGSDGSLVIQHDFMNDVPNDWLVANLGTIILSPPESDVPRLSAVRKVDLRVDPDGLVAGFFEIHHVSVSESGTEVVETWRVSAAGRLSVQCLAHGDGDIVLLDPLMENPACRAFAQ